MYGDQPGQIAYDDIFLETLYNFLKDYGFFVGSQIILSSKLSIQNNNYTQEHKCLLEKLFLLERKNHVLLIALSLGCLFFLKLIMQHKFLAFRPFWIYTTINFFKTFSPLLCVLKILNIKKKKKKTPPCFYKQSSPLLPKPI